MATTWDLKHTQFTLRTDEDGTLISVSYNGRKEAADDVVPVTSTQEVSESKAVADMNGATVIACQAAIDAILGTEVVATVP